MVARAGVINNQGKVVEDSVIYSLIGEDYSVSTVPVAKLLQAMKKKEVEVTNLEVENGKIVASNGAMDKYPLVNLNTREFVGKQSAIILNRVELNDRLLGYTVFCADGVIREVNLPNALELYNTVGIANGKIRHTNSGDIISSIKGNYPLRVIDIKNVESKEITFGTTFVTEAVGSISGSAAYVGVIISCDNAADMAKMIDKLVEENKKVIAAASKLGASKDSLQSLRLRRELGTSIYAVIPLKTYHTMVEKDNCKVAFPMEKMFMSGLDYTDGSMEETLVTVSKDFTLEKIKEGNDRTNKAIKKLIDVELPKFKAKGIA